RKLNLPRILRCAVDLSGAGAGPSECCPTGQPSTPIEYAQGWHAEIRPVEEVEEFSPKFQVGCLAQLPDCSLLDHRPVHRGDARRDESMAAEIPLEIAV